MTLLRVVKILLIPIIMFILISLFQLPLVLNYLPYKFLFVIFFQSH